jgi:hypothetical protein
MKVIKVLVKKKVILKIDVKTIYFYILHYTLLNNCGKDKRF